ncbi:hypothetical protein N7539_004800 [Penicillium diatomitis]|uniref:Uncharacterized protein n=1 Tax=Penicillium diatomitis TaxID=2819901 RepID=A0A9W9X5V2_9EURO|nr:uncharacterized protein N7539_004800 [Penicillium diatomitis]KAJ5484812.1 hypothetical protein N7539_004800 [Penicillium diatomitis]
MSYTEHIQTTCQTASGKCPSSVNTATCATQCGVEPDSARVGMSGSSPTLSGLVIRPPDPTASMPEAEAKNMVSQSLKGAA